jgi:hypothetical protein
MSISFPCLRCGGYHAVGECSSEAALMYLRGLLTLPGMNDEATATEDEEIRRYRAHRRQPRA